MFHAIVSPAFYLMLAIRYRPMVDIIWLIKINVGVTHDVQSFSIN